MRRILVADPDSNLSSWVDAIIQALSASATLVYTSEQLETALLEQGPFDLVLTHAQLSGRSGLQVLARVRALKESVPFIVVLSIHGSLLRVMVSDTSAQTLSSRMLDRQNLAALARVLVKESYRPAGCNGAV
jgi:DNA-binding response OmpR family regulator